MNRSRLAVAAMALALGLGSGALAQDDEARAQARAHFDTGVARYEQGDFQGALEAFQEAYRIAPHPMVRVNMANCYEQLGRPLEALHHFERFLAEAETATRAQRREVQAAIARLQHQIAEVRLAVAPDGALVTIDGTETRRAPILDPIRMTPGTHRIEVRLDGYRTDRREIEVVAGQPQRITIRLERGSDEPAPAAVAPAEAAAEPSSADELAEAAAAPREDPVATREPPSSGGFQLRFTTPVIASASAAAAFTVAAIISGSIALEANSDFETYVSRAQESPLTPDERQKALAAVDLANTASVLTDIFIIGAIASAGLTAFFIVVEGMGEEPEAAHAGVRLLPVVAPGAGGLALGGRF